MDYSERFWKKVNKTETCWLWMAAQSTFGYGKVSFNGKSEYAHRVSYVLANGPIPKEKHILHKCDTPLCVNPSHLFLGDQDANNKDRTAKGKTPHGEGHHNSVLTDDIVRQMRVLRDGGMMIKDIADKFGVGRMTVNYAVRRLSWQHVV